MRKLLLFVALLSVFCFGIENVSYSTFYSDSGLIEAIDFENDKDSTEAFGTRIIDTLTKSYVSWSALNSGDSTVSRINADTIGGSPYVESSITTPRINTDTVRGNPNIDSISGDVRFTGAPNIDGALDAPTLNTGQGDNELFDMDQNVMTTNTVTFDSIISTKAISAPSLNTGQGDNELYSMNQDVKTTDTVTFDTLTITNGLKVGSFSGASASYDTITVANGISSANLNTGNGANELYAMDQDVQTADNVIFDSITVANGINISGDPFNYSTGKFYATYTGFSGTVQDSIRYTIIGNVVVLSFDAFTATSNAPSFSIDTASVPSILYPSFDIVSPGSGVQDNGGSTTLDFCVHVKSSGATFGNIGLNCLLTGWTNTNGKGFVFDATITYRLK